MQDRNYKSTSTTYPVVSINQFPVLTVDEMREVDRIMIEDIGVSLDQMMENAGRNLAQFIRTEFGPDSQVCVLVGKGSNGGGGLVAARHLANWGHTVCIVLATPGHYFHDQSMRQLRIVNNMQIPTLHGWLKEKSPEIAQQFQETDVIVDALIGYSLVGKPQDVYADLIRWANQAQKPVIALDGPSGLNLSSGRCFEPTINAAATLTLAAPKEGLAKNQADKVTGEVYVADISVPDVVWDELNYSVKNLFRLSPILKLKI